MVKKGDLWLLAAILLLGAGLLLIWKIMGKSGMYAVVSVDGAVVKELPLDKDTTYTVRTEQGYNIVEIKDGAVSMCEADCRDKICVRHQAIDTMTESIICLPHKLVVEVRE